MDEKRDGTTGATIEEFGLAQGKPFAAGLLARTGTTAATPGT